MASLSVQIIVEETLSQQSEVLSPSQLGYQFEHDELKRLLRRFSGFASVEITDAYGYELTEEIIEQRFGSDGGVDCVIHVSAMNERGLSWIITRVRNIIKNGDY